MTDRELMQEALYALTYVGDAKEIYSDTIESLRARLAQPEEPDWSAAGFSKPPKQWDRQCPSCGGFCKKSGCERENVQPEQRSEQWWRHEVSNAWAEGYEKGRASVKQPEQEPVWVEVTTNTGDKFILDSAVEADKIRAAKNVGLSVVPLYTAPPQREWQTLTENEIKHLWYEACQTNLELTSQLIMHLARNIEAKLKDKNNAV